MRWNSFFVNPPYQYWSASLVIYRYLEYQCTRSSSAVLSEGLQTHQFNFEYIEDKISFSKFCSFLCFLKNMCAGVYRNFNKTFHNLSQIARICSPFERIFHVNGNLKNNFGLILFLHRYKKNFSLSFLKHSLFCLFMLKFYIKLVNTIIIFVCWCNTRSPCMYSCYYKYVSCQL